MVKCPDPISEKIVHLVAKHNALEDCMAVVKKAFENDELELKEFLQNIRQLSTKQAKQVQKMFKINQTVSASAGGGQDAYSLPAMPQQPQFAGYQ